MRLSYCMAIDLRSGCLWAPPITRYTSWSPRCIIFLCLCPRWRLTASFVWHESSAMSKRAQNSIISALNNAAPSRETCLHVRITPGASYRFMELNECSFVRNKCRALFSYASDFSGALGFINDRLCRMLQKGVSASCCCGYRDNLRLVPIGLLSWEASLVRLWFYGACWCVTLHISRLGVRLCVPGACLVLYGDTAARCGKYRSMSDPSLSPPPPLPPFPLVSPFPTHKTSICR